MREFLFRFFYKLSHWEYWSLAFVYYPLFPVWCYFALRAKSFFFITAANPKIENGGLVMESKMKIYDTLPKASYPETLFCSKKDTFEHLCSALQNTTISFPLIAKPDVGMKGWGVKQIHNLEELEEYAQAMPIDFLLQEKISFENEVGVFYIRKPSEKAGKVEGVAFKNKAKVIGDGISTLKKLVMKEPRYRVQYDIFEKRFKEKWLTVIAKGELVDLQSFGSHYRGAEFKDISGEVDMDRLSETINKVALQVPEFYYGRFDIMYDNFDDMCDNDKFSIIELNGVGGEPTHMYDASKHSIFSAWKMVVKYWVVLLDICLENKKRGFSFLSFREGIKLLRMYGEYKKELSLFV